MHARPHRRKDQLPRVAVNRSNFSGRKDEPFDRIAGIEWNAVEFYRICCMAWSLRQVATLRHGHKARRSAPAFRALGVCEHI